MEGTPFAFAVGIASEGSKRPRPDPFYVWLANLQNMGGCLSKGSAKRRPEGSSSELLKKEAPTSLDTQAEREEAASGPTGDEVRASGAASGEDNSAKLGVESSGKDHVPLVESSSAPVNAKLTLADQAKEAESGFSPRPLQRYVIWSNPMNNIHYVS